MKSKLYGILMRREGFSLYGMWIEYEGPMANSCAGACNLV